jgi:hypothetical protein
MYAKKKLIELYHEEQKTSREYKKHGLLKFSKDEARHAAFFKMLAKQGR